MGSSKAEVRSIAMERVERLIDLASDVYDSRPELAHRYVELAWRIKTRYNLSLPSRLKRKFCRKCLSLWVPGVTCRVRLRPSRPPHMAVTCLECGRVWRIPYKRRK